MEHDGIGLGEIIITYNYYGLQHYFFGFVTGDQDIDWISQARKMGDDGSTSVARYFLLYTHIRL